MCYGLLFAYLYCSDVLTVLIKMYRAIASDLLTVLFMMYHAIASDVLILLVLCLVA